MECDSVLYGMERLVEVLGGITVKEVRLQARLEMKEI